MSGEPLPRAVAEAVIEAAEEVLGEALPHLSVHERVAFMRGFRRELGWPVAELRVVRDE